MRRLRAAEPGRRRRTGGARLGRLGAALPKAGAVPKGARGSAGPAGSAGAGAGRAWGAWGRAGPPGGAGLPWAEACRGRGQGGRVSGRSTWAPGWSSWSASGRQPSRESPAPRASSPPFLSSLHVWLETPPGTEDEGSPACPPSVDPDLCCLSGRSSGTPLSGDSSLTHALWAPCAASTVAATSCTGAGLNTAVTAESSEGEAAGLGGASVAATSGSVLPLPSSCSRLGSWLDGSSLSFQWVSAHFPDHSFLSLPWFRSLPFSFPALHVLCLSLVCFFLLYPGSP